jgi:hemoglobin-like flavoprotein
MNSQQIKLIQLSYAAVMPISDKVAACFYERLFELESELRSLFSKDIEEQGRKLMNTLYTVVYNLDRLEKVVAPVQALGNRHADYGVQPQHYELVGAALLWSLEQNLQDMFTPEVAEAWATAYGLLAGLMKEALVKAGSNL